VLKSLLHCFVSLAFGGSVVTLCVQARQPEHVYPEVSDPRVKVCEATDLPNPTPRHYHSLTGGGYRCFTHRGATWAVKEYRLPD
jgi:hypothetical protein